MINAELHHVFFLCSVNTPILLLLVIERFHNAVGPAATFTLVNDLKVTPSSPPLLGVKELEFMVLFRGSTDRHAHS